MAAHPGLDGYLLLGWLLVITGVGVSSRFPRWGEGLASAAVALGTLAAALGGSDWYEIAATGNYDVSRYSGDDPDCTAVPTDLLLASLGERLTTRASLLVICAIAVALFIRARTLVPEASARLRDDTPHPERLMVVGVTGLSLAVAFLAWVGWAAADSWALKMSSGDVSQLPFTGPILTLMFVSFAALMPGWFPRHGGRTATVLGFGLAFGQLGAVAAVAQSHALGRVTRDGGNVTVGSDLTQTQRDTVDAFLLSYAAAMLVFAVIWALSTWGERRLAGEVAAPASAEGDELRTPAESGMTHD